MSATQLLVACAAVFAGAATQSLVGFGLNLIVVPVALLAGAEELVPGALIVVLLAQASTLILGDRGHADVQLLAWFLPVRLIGTLAGLAVATQLSGDEVVVLICVLVIAAVLMSIRGWRVPSRPGAWMATGFASGFSNVLSSIGGPPLALVMTDRSPSAQRATQGWSAVVGSVMSIVVLSLDDRFGMVDVRRGVVLIPLAIAGSLAVRPIRGRWATADALRPMVWAVAIGGSVLTILRTLLR